MLAHGGSPCEKMLLRFILDSYTHQNRMTEIFIIIGLILLNGLFSMSEVAMISARKARLSSDADKGSKTARTALALAGNPDRFLSTVQIGITLIGILTGIYSGSGVAREFTALLCRCGMPVVYAAPLAQGVIVVVVTFLTIVFGELVPKRIALSQADRVARLMARPMHLTAVLAAPFVWLLARSTEGVMRLISLRESTNKVTEEEIKSIIEEGAEDGAVAPVEKNIMQRVFMMGDLKVGSIMTHRSDIVWLESGMTVEEVQEVLRSDLYESYPVADGDLDHVVGMVWLKDLVGHLSGGEFSLRKLAREPVYFHEGMSIYRVLEEMRQKRLSRAMICDEYGDFVGVVTLKDIFEGLVGNMDNPGEEPEIVKRAAGDGWLVDGQCPLYDLLCYFGRSELEATEGYHTLAGLLLDRLQRIPRCGESLSWNGFTFEIMDMDGARIDKVLVTVTAPAGRPATSNPVRTEA